MPDSPEEKALKRQMQVEALKHDLSKAMRVEDQAKFYLQQGTNPRYVAHRYGIDVERCERYAAALKRQKELERERTDAMRGNSESPVIGESVDRR